MCSYEHCACCLICLTFHAFLSPVDIFFNVFNNDPSFSFQYRMRDITNLQFRIETANNETLVAYVDNRQANYDNIGALYYVVAVVLIYGLSIVMMIASHIRKNKQDSQLRAYLKDMAALRKKNRREKILEKMTDIASKTNPIVKTLENPMIDESKRQESDVALYGRLPTEADDDSSRDILLSRYSNSDNDDSVFHLPNDFCIDIPKDVPRNESPKTPRTPKMLTPKLINKEARTFFQVINENVPL